jgi:nucleoside-diphosphate-sugar epimerase
MKIFITGASGYIGGSVAVHLRDQGHDVTGLVRSDENAARLAALGVVPVVGHLAETAVIARAVQASDAVINTAEADDVDLLKPLLAALMGTGKALIHTSGSSIVVDDAQGEIASSIIFDDDDPYTPMLHRLKRVAVDRLVRTAGVSDGIRATVICPTMVYGAGRGLRRDSHQIPLLIAKSRSIGAGAYIGKGAPIWSNISIDDLVTLYSLAVEKAPAGAFFFAENGEATFLEIAETISRSLGLSGETQSWSLDDAIAEIGGVARVALATNCRVRATNARRLLGWAPDGPSLTEALVAAA